MLRHIIAIVLGTIVGTFHSLPARSSELIAKITVQQFEFEGNTAFGEAELDTVVQPWLGRPLGFPQLQAARDAITTHYAQAGYVTSFALLPPESNQHINADAATITLRVVEGTITSVTATNPTPLTQTIAQRLPAPQLFNQTRLLEQLQFLRLQPGIRDLQAELLPTGEAGQSQLQLKIIPASRFELVTSANSQESSDTGSWRRGIDFQWLQPLNRGDRLTGNFSNTEGSNSWGLNYALPLGRSGKTEIDLDYRALNQRIVRAPFDEIDIRTQATVFNFNADRTVLQRASRGNIQIAKLGATLSLINSRSSILGQPFPLTPEVSNEGKLKFSVLRLFQDYQQRDAESAFSARSQLNIGLPGGTTGENGVNGQFVSWQGQTLLNRNTTLGQWGLRVTGQLSGDDLPSYEQLDLARMRGYSANTLLSNSGLLLSNELKIPLQRSDQGLFLAPFIDMGLLHRPEQSPRFLVSGGLSLIWMIPLGFTAQLSYEIPFTQPDRRSWQDNQLNFSVQYKRSF
jgi:hemolysin activation/secretion protein